MIKSLPDCLPVLGMYIWPNGTMYVGGWQDDRHHGFGVKTWATSRYEGMWKMDNKHG